MYALLLLGHSVSLIILRLKSLLDLLTLRVVEYDRHFHRTPTGAAIQLY